MKKYIHVTRETRAKLMKIFGCTERMVFYALQFDAEKGNSDLARRIRKAALECGGIEMVTVPTVETFFDADGYMRQYFPNGAMLEINKDTGDTEILKEGRTMKSYKSIILNQIPAIQAEARNL